MFAENEHLYAYVDSIKNSYDSRTQHKQYLLCISDKSKVNVS